MNIFRKFITCFLSTTSPPPLYEGSDDTFEEDQKFFVKTKIFKINKLLGELSEKENLQEKTGWKHEGNLYTRKVHKSRFE